MLKKDFGRRVRAFAFRGASGVCPESFVDSLFGAASKSPNAQAAQAGDLAVRWP